MRFGEKIGFSFEKKYFLTPNFIFLVRIGQKQLFGDPLCVKQKPCRSFDKHDWWWLTIDDRRQWLTKNVIDDWWSKVGSTVDDWWSMCGLTMDDIRLKLGLTMGDSWFKFGWTMDDRWFKCDRLTTHDRRLKYNDVRGEWDMEKEFNLLWCCAPLFSDITKTIHVLFYLDDGSNKVIRGIY